MALTPEARVKKMIREALQARGFVQVGHGVIAPRWYWMPVAGIYATAGVHDFLGMCDGVGWSIEAKAKGGTMTEHQRDFYLLVECAGGVAAEVRNEADMDSFLSRLEVACGNDRKNA